MTLENTTNRTTSAGNDITTDFNFDFKVLTGGEETDLKIYLIDTDTQIATLQTYTTDYTVTLSTTSEGGTVSFIDPPSSDDEVLIYREVDYTQETDIQINSRFPESAVEDALDKTTMLSQQLNEILERTPKFALTSSLTDIEIEDLIANKILMVNAAGNGIEMSDEDFTDIQADLATLAAISDDITTVAGISANVTTVAGISANVTTIAGVASYIPTVAGISTDISTVGAIAADVTIVAGIETEIESVVANLSDIQNAASFGFPTLVSGDVGKYLKVNAGHNGYDVQTLGSAALIDTGTTSGKVPLLGMGSATTILAGLAELLTDGELAAGTDISRVPTASNIASLFGTSLRSSNGYARLPVKVSGAFVEFILQWQSEASFHDIVTDYAITFTHPIAFPTAALIAFTGIESSSSENDAITPNYYNLTTTNISLTGTENSGVTNAVKYKYIAIGY